MRIAPILLLVATLLATLACSGGSASLAPADDCAALGDCCATLPTSTGMVCSEQLTQARAQSSSEAACHALLGGYRADGLCSGSAPAPSDGGGTHDAAADAPPSAEPAVCARYIDCISTVTPAGLPATLQAYGPSGTCWTSTPAVAADCVSACTSGVAMLHPENPTACSLCATNADCAGSAGGPACEVGQGACVACVVDADCAGNSAGPACDTASHTCVPCTTDTHCSSAGAPHCDPAAHACVGCTAAFQCSSNVCYQQACCTPKACDPAQYQCGTIDDGCGGMAACGTCALGACGDFNHCTTVGVACTPGTPGQCVASERCLADGWHQDYRCSPIDVQDSSCSTYPDPNCDSYTASDNTPVDTFTCVGTGVCKQNCITQTDCPAGTTCTPWTAGGMPQTISASLPGQCL